MKILLIGNPVSGGGKAAGLMKALVTGLTERGHDTETFRTSGPGDALRRAGNLPDGIGALVVCGGDGTLNEVLNGLENPEATPIAVLPAGTANVISHELALTRVPGELIRTIEAGHVRRIDMGIANGHRFLMIASAGFDALVTREIKKERKGTLGYRRYLLPIAKTLSGYRPPTLNITVDGGEAVNGELVIISNTRNYGGLFTVTPDARCDSGCFDICVLHAASFLSLCRFGIEAFFVGRISPTLATYMKGRQIKIETYEQTPVELDGDYFGTTPLEVDIVPAAVPILI